MSAEDSGGGSVVFEEHVQVESLVANMLGCFPSSALERKLVEAETEKFNIKQMKDLFEQKAAQLATEIVGQCGTGRI